MTLRLTTGWMRRALTMLAFFALPAQAELVVYTAQLIRTMEPALPTATAVAVEGGSIIAVGSEASLQPLVAARAGRIDRRFADDILLPGFIDPHVHPALPAVLTQFPFLAPDDWSLPTGEFPGETSPEGYRTRLKALVNQHTDATIPFITWGYHPLWHGEIWRQDLNDWFGDQPVMLWHRSFHELIGNDAAWALLGVTAADAQMEEGANWERGHFYENGLKAVVPKLGFLFSPQRFGGGMFNFLAMLHQAGVTTALDMGTGIFGNPAGEIASVRAAAHAYPVPVRLILTPIIVDFLSRGKTPEEALAEILGWQAANDERVLVGNHFKLMIDGAIFSGLAQMGPPGYLDGHEGIWMVPELVLRAYAEVFWRSGFQLHAHANGDAAVGRFLDLVEGLQRDFPRPDHRATIEHLAYSTEQQSAQLAKLGAQASVNPYYHYILSEAYSKDWLGPDRASQMTRLGSLERNGVPITLHSDAPMAPLSPLTLVWAASERKTISGAKGLETERLSRASALEAVTSGAARIIGRENEIGSIRAGKRADFVVLEADPLTVSGDALRHIKVTATVFAGVPYPTH
ncbi:MAG: amidohydrolase family protein [Luminiphilus sp.]|jgi:predicted amidohydrolase YtcJ|nr:amidohydrolase family protein [Luminiphilus sp.]